MEQIIEFLAFLSMQQYVTLLKCSGKVFILVNSFYAGLHNLFFENWSSYYFFSSYKVFMKKLGFWSHIPQVTWRKTKTHSKGNSGLCFIFMQHFLRKVEKFVLK